MHFEFATAGRILFGPGVLGEMGPLARQMGQRALVLTGSTPARATPLMEVLAMEKIEYALFPVAGEPTTDLVARGVQKAREMDAELVIGFGGGSVVDTAKAVAVLVNNPGEMLDYLEVIGRGKALARPGIPCVAVATTAGAGTEATRNAVILSPQHRVKVSLRGPWLLPRLAVVDPELSYDLPASITASTGLDALTQLIEPYLSVRANAITDVLCGEGMKRVARSLLRAYESGSDNAARVDMSLAALFGGMALANAGLGAVHGFAGPIGGMFPAPHGAVCAALLPHVLDVNLRVLSNRAPDEEKLVRLDEVARILTRDDGARAANGVAWVKEMCARLGIPPLGSYGVSQRDVPEICSKAAVSSSMKGNPVKLVSDELKEIVERAL